MKTSKSRDNKESTEKTLEQPQGLKDDTLEEKQARIKAKLDEMNARFMEK